MRLSFAIVISTEGRTLSVARKNCVVRRQKDFSLCCEITELEGVLNFEIGSDSEFVAVLALAEEEASKPRRL